MTRLLSASGEDHLSREHLREALLHSVILAGVAVASYWLVSHALGQIYSISKDDDRLGAMWAVIASVFVYRFTYRDSLKAAMSRAAATFLAIVLCLVYLTWLPFHLWGLAVLLGAGTLIMLLAGRPDDIVSTAATITVVLVVAAVTPRDAWEQPLLRLVDTLVGIVIGLVGAWIDLHLRPALRLPIDAAPPARESAPGPGATRP